MSVREREREREREKGGGGGGARECAIHLMYYVYSVYYPQDWVGLYPS